MGKDSEMSNKLKEVILELDKAKNLIRNQQKEIDKLKNVMVDNVIKADKLTEAGGMVGVLREKVSLQADYIAQLEKGLESSIAMNKAQAERQVKELTDEEILQFQDKVPYTLGSDLIEFARAILRKAQDEQ